MKRDFDLMREILLQVEAVPPGMGIDYKDFPNVERGVFEHHIQLLKQAELVDTVDRSSIDEQRIMAIALTWMGCEFLDVARDTNLWREAMTLVRQAGESISFESLSELLNELHAWRVQQLCG